MFQVNYSVTQIVESLLPGHSLLEGQFKFDDLGHLDFSFEQEVEFESRVSLVEQNGIGRLLLKKQGTGNLCHLLPTLHVSFLEEGDVLEDS